MPSLEELLSPPQTAGFGAAPKDFNVLGLDWSDIGIGLAAYAIVAVPILLWTPVAIVAIFMLLSGLAFGIVAGLVGMIYLENHPPENRWIGTPYIGGYDARTTAYERQWMNEKE